LVEGQTKNFAVIAPWREILAAKKYLLISSLQPEMSQLMDTIKK